MSTCMHAHYRNACIPDVWLGVYFLHLALLQPPIEAAHRVQFLEPHLQNNINAPLFYTQKGQRVQLVASANNAL